VEQADYQPDQHKNEYDNHGREQAGSGEGAPNQTADRVHVCGIKARRIPLAKAGGASAAV